jgi:hypothetical protein
MPHVKPDISNTEPGDFQGGCLLLESFAIDEEEILRTDFSVAIAQNNEAHANRRCVRVDRCR